MCIFKTLQKNRKLSSFGKDQRDFKHVCCFKHQIINIGQEIEDGNGETVKIPMVSGKVALFRLFSEKYDSAFEYTGQRNWYFLFLRYEEETEKKRCIWRVGQK